MIETLTTAAISLAGLAGLAFMYGVLIPDQNKRIARIKKEFIDDTFKLQEDIEAIGRNQRDIDLNGINYRLDKLADEVEKHENTYKALTSARRVARWRAFNKFNIMHEEERQLCEYCLSDDTEYDTKYVDIAGSTAPDRLVSQCCKCGQKSTLWRFEVMNVIEINKEIELLEDKSKISDGSHTFEELYHHRAILFSIICNTYKNQSWKSWKHDDGTMFEDYFVVGVTTEQGEYSYHYHKDYWKYFEVKELTYAPVWDGHKPSDIERLFTL